MSARPNPTGKPISVLLENETDRRLRERAAADDRGLSDQIRHYIRRGLRDDEARRAAGG